MHRDGGIRAPLRIGEVLRRIDAGVLMLQELSNSRDAEMGATRVERFARELGMHAIHRATLTRDDAEYGNACLTRIEPS
jgi:endonuclease/exonuclease/phosphatase family metal-dependent hydrolase